MNAVHLLRQFAGFAASVRREVREVIAPGEFVQVCEWAENRPRSISGRVPRLVVVVI